MRYFILLFIAFSVSFHLQAQSTSGGSTDRWEEYSVKIDTVAKEVPIEIKSTSAMYLRFSRINGQGIMAEENEAIFPPGGVGGYPQNGFMGNAGNDLIRGFEFSLGGYENWESINKNLHPGIDFSGIYDIGFQRVERKFEGDIEDFRVDYGNYFGFWAGFGIGVTLKPSIIANLNIEQLDDLLLDVGIRADLLLFGSGSSTFEVDNVYFLGAPNTFYDYTREIETDELNYVGSRIDRVFSVGLRYKFLGIRWETSGILANLIQPQYYVNDYLDQQNSIESSSEEVEHFEENIDYRFSKIGIQLFF